MRRQRDPRRFSMIDNNIAENPKLMELDDAGAFATYLMSIFTAGNTMSDGKVKPDYILRKTGTAGRTVLCRGKQVPYDHALITVGLWHAPGHHCKRCPQPPPGFVWVHDYTAHQPSRAEREDLVSERRRNGVEGAKKRWAEHNAAKEAARQAAAEAPAAALGTAPATAGGTAPGTAPAMARATADGMARAMASAEEALADTPEPPEKTVASRSRRKTKIRSDFAVSDEMRAWATERAGDIVDLDASHERFIDYWLGRGTPMDDWSAQWRSWMMEEQRKARDNARFPRRRTPYQNPGSSQELDESWARAVGQ